MTERKLYFSHKSTSRIKLSFYPEFKGLVFKVRIYFDLKKANILSNYFRLQSLKYVYEIRKWLNSITELCKRLLSFVAVLCFDAVPHHAAKTSLKLAEILLPQLPSRVLHSRV